MHTQIIHRRVSTIALVAAVLAGLLLAAGPASADTTIDAQICKNTFTGSVSLSASTLVRGESATLSWQTNWPVQCGLASLVLSGYSTDDMVVAGYNSGSYTSGSAGSIIVTPNQTNTDNPWSLHLETSAGSKPVGTVAVTVTDPDALPAGQTSVDITGSDSAQRVMFIRAISTPGTTIRIAGDVNLDLSGLHDLYLAPRVQIIGIRTLYPRGPRLFTRTFPRALLNIGGIGEVPPSDGVRITGIRLDGGQGETSAESDALGATGISVYSSVNVEISESEVYGWRGTGIFVDDARELIDLAKNPNAVRIHDNFIHHNQHYREEGYGIAVHSGAYALIEQNVFDYDRHALEGDGRTGSGYLAERNLFLTNGGDNTSITSTHILDMHGTEPCWGFTAYCGQAGEYMKIRNNTILYDDGTGFRLRGRPTIRADVSANVFAHSQVWSGWVPFVDDGALSQTVDGDDIKEIANTFGLNTLGETGSCDFDGDGTADSFLATGVTWWYASSRLGGRWVYLNASPKRRGDVALADFDHDGRCDVTYGGVLYSGGKAPIHTDLLWHTANGTPYPTSSTWKIDTGGGATTVKNPGNLLYGDVLGTGDFDADGDSDVFTRTLDGTLYVSLLSDNNLLGNEYSDGLAPDGSAFQGIADFDGDGYDDVLWRLADGHYRLWFAGSNLRAADIESNPVDPRWKVQGVADFNGDGSADILFHSSSTGAVTMWYMNGIHRVGSTPSNTMDPSGASDPAWTWQIAGTGDLTGDGAADLLWRKSDGSLTLWPKGIATGSAAVSYRNTGTVTDPTWQVIGIGDANGDGRGDIFWQHGPVSNASGPAGQIAIWLMNGSQFIADRFPGTADSTATLVGLLPAKGVKVHPVAATPGNLTNATGTAVNLPLAATSGTAPYTWSVTGLPAGLTSDASGRITGTPTSPGTRTVTATVTDASGLTGSMSFTWTIQIAVPNLYARTRTEAIAALQAVGLVAAPGGTLPTDDIDMTGLVVRQTISTGTLVPAGTVVGFSTGVYQPNRCGPNPC